MTGTDFDEVQRQVQGNILRGYGKEFRCVRHLVLGVIDPGRARAVLGRMVSGDGSIPQLTWGEQAPKDMHKKWCLNVGLTCHGLRALGVPDTSLRTFPPEFIEGMAARAGRLADYGDSAPENWRDDLRHSESVHLIITVHGYAFSDIDPISQQVLAADDGAFQLLSDPPLDGESIDHGSGPARHVHFGYRDGISQPRFEGIHDPARYADRQQFTPIGAVLLGHPTALAHVRWRVPYPRELGVNGSFNAFRVLRQDVVGFERYLSDAAAKLGWSKELVAAKLCGRWRNGSPLSLAPTETAADALVASATTLNELNDFDYLDDADGTGCPIGSHIRRNNPRRAHIVQRAANRTRPLVRRCIPYGRRFEPSQPDDGIERGLLGNFICASLAAQFEATHHDWLNLGLQDPRITGTNDPLVGANEAATGRFDLYGAGVEVVLSGLPRFVQTRGGAYCFLPSRKAMKWIASSGRNAT